MGDKIEDEKHQGEWNGRFRVICETHKNELCHSGEISFGRRLHMAGWPEENGSRDSRAEGLCLQCQTLGENLIFFCSEREENVIILRIYNWQ